jgi:uncharacterized protein YjbJ (UPF0337 family)
MAKIKMNRNEVRGKALNLKGRLKEAAGVVTGNRRLENEGTVERIEGAVEAGVGTRPAARSARPLPGSARPSSDSILKWMYAF